ncbi:MAG: T9SS type A sorting domain-containing protein [bacterium]
MRGLALLCIATVAFGLPWPHFPTNQPHHVGNYWGNYQDYGGSPYLHNGIDIMTVSMAPCVAIKAGYVKQIWTNANPLYNGLTVADSAGTAFCHGLMYYHVDPTTIRVQVGDTVRVGDTLAMIVNWPVANFHHNHFSWNRNSGQPWSSYGGFFRNPLLDLVPYGDSIVPNFLDAYPNQRFAICTDNTSNYQGKDSVYGRVDLICRLEDRVNHRLWKVNVHRIMFTIRDSVGNTVVPPTRGFEFTDSLDGYTRVQSRVVYKQDGVCPTRCDYDSLNRRYYFIFTNTNGDSLIQAQDSLGHWNTTAVPDGPYWIIVAASDRAGNLVTDSMMVRVKNNPAPVRDVGVAALVMLPLVERGLLVAPVCSVQNYGTTTESYTVRLRIGTTYDSTLGVVSQPPGSKYELVFPPWMAPGVPGPYAVSCSTRLAGDQYPANNARYCTTRVALHNVGASAILAPRDTVDSGAVVVPRAVVRNSGDRNETFDVRFRIGVGYSDRRQVTVPSGMTDTVAFASWTAPGQGWHATSCSTELGIDDDPTDNKVEDSVYVLPGTGLASEPAPPALALHGARPNPLGGAGWVRYDLSLAGPVALELHDAAGRRVAVLAAGVQPAGRHRVRLDGSRLAAGVYWLRLRVGDRVLTGKVVVNS